MARVTVFVCKICGKVKYINTFIVIDPELQKAIDKGMIDVDLTQCGICGGDHGEKNNSS